jgi:lipid A 3-O-deacylase
MKHLRLAVILCLVLIPAICQASEHGYVYPNPEGYAAIPGTPDDLKPAGSANLKVPVSSSIWVDGVGSGFQRNTFQVGGVIGAGLGTKVLGSHLRHDLALASANFGWVFTGVLAPGHWYSGNLELVTELFGGGQFHPDAGYFVGLTPFIRYNFATVSGWVPFVEGGAGVSVTDIDYDLSGRFQFNLQGGAGVNHFLTDRTALTAQYRWLHFSNAGIEKPNYGVNTQMFLIGVTWFY